MPKYICTMCEVDKDSDRFFHSRFYGKDGRMKHCKECHNQLGKRWREANKEKSSAYSRDYARIWRANNPERNRQRKREYNSKIKMRVMRTYSKSNEPFCACCGENILQFLSIDHINNDGAKHRKILGNGKSRGGTSGQKMYEWLIKNNFPSGFQVLCMNCNCGKERNGGVCPHVTPEEYAKLEVEA